MINLLYHLILVSVAYISHISTSSCDLIDAKENKSKVANILGFRWSENSAYFWLDSWEVISLDIKFKTGGHFRLSLRLERSRGSTGCFLWLFSLIFDSFTIMVLSVSFYLSCSGPVGSSKAGIELFRQFRNIVSWYHWKSCLCPIGSFLSLGNSRVDLLSSVSF